MIRRVALDLDNVVVDILVSARAVAAALAGVPVGDVIDTGIYAAPFTHHDATIAARLTTPHAFWQREDVLAGAGIMPGAREALWQLHGRDMLAGYITRRPARAQGITSAWVEFHGLPMVPVHHVGHENQALNHEACKADVCQAIGATHLVDDSQDEIERAMRRGIIPVLVNHPLGRNARTAWLSNNGGVTVVDDVVEAVRLLTAD